MADQRGFPRWHLWIGAALALCGLVLGFVLPVGPHCGAAFPTAYSPVPASAVAPPGTDWVAECRSAAQDESHLYGGFVLLGLGLVALGLLLRFFSRRSGSR
ncbi:hypothetical protein LK10_17070 [Sinomonas humi]|uniref:Uncharacterized protein n=1 Tax=Sinomonas humi TaxID=1338436 RepID=A0A0B2AGR6_9MICC|nr:hypothetical protein LK10_17070 [Sinomonas humi]